jgi:hypothetical protein
MKLNHDFENPPLMRDERQIDNTVAITHNLTSRRERREPEWISVTMRVIVWNTGMGAT